jgi:hypothetical protein
VLGVLEGELFDGGVDGFDAAVLAHGLGGVVGVGAGAVPVAFHGLGLEGAGDAEVFTQAVQQPAGEHDMVADFQGASGADLKLPLAGHDLGVDAADLQPGLDAGVHVGLHEGPPVDGLQTHPAVERPLRVREAALGPPVDLARLVEHGVLLLEPEQRLLRQHVRAQNVLELAPRVGLMRSAVRVQNLAQHQHVILTTNGVRAAEHRVQNAVGEFPLRLPSADQHTSHHQSSCSEKLQRWNSVIRLR